MFLTNLVFEVKTSNTADWLTGLDARFTKPVIPGSDPSCGDFFFFLLVPPQQKDSGVHSASKNVYQRNLGRSTRPGNGLGNTGQTPYPQHVLTAWKRGVLTIKTVIARAF